jgi:hypothetical protein
MTDRSREQHERRRDPRIAAKGTLRFSTRAHGQRGRLANLSVGGAYILTHVAAPARMLRRIVDIELRLDAGDAQWHHATGTIVRIDPGGIAIAFDMLAAPLLHMIDELSTASRARARILVAVLIDEDPKRISAMAAGFRATGCKVIEAATPLEAIVRLGETSFEPDVIAVADSKTDNADQMRAFVEREHPTTKLITIGDEIFHPDGFANWLSSANPNADLASRVRDALVAPRHRR